MSPRNTLTSSFARSPAQGGWGGRGSCCCRRAGFTLIEMVIVVGIVLIVMGIALPSTSTRITYTNSELESWLGQPGVTFSGSGTASGGSITVSAGDALTIDVTLDATIEIGG